ncbi:DUF1127 domain-containing protein [Loktanella sp. IMCC34160]|uniref:DUF1127 domain-containing protein n=1 Tax=Loktanella sp. IMCC34160 TaxID=2510646 RepID=UPI001F5DFC97|nr:DUF1127 domain-containing protein [Loktanella sp. IMCC34160]
MVNRAIAGLYNAAETLRAWNDARVTRKALSQLSNRELDDIGLCRGDIEDIAQKGLRF